MRRVLFILMLPACFSCYRLYCQKKYGYTTLNFRCGDNDSQRDRVYFSPIIELNRLNFPQYTDGMDPKIPPYSVRYYNYAISKWFETYLKDNYHIMVNTTDRYARKSVTFVYNEKNKGGCDADKTNAACFYTNEQELITLRKKAVDESRLSGYSNRYCEIINL